MSLTIKEIEKLQIDFDKKHSGSKTPFFKMINENNIEELEHLVVCLLGEIGEFSNIVKKIRRGDFDFNNKKIELEEELVDTFIYLLKIAIQCNFDLEKGYIEKLKKNELRFRRYEQNDVF